MIEILEVTNYRGEVFTFNFSEAPRYGIVITNITGIDAPNATIFDQDNASSDGSTYTSSKADKRNIVITASFDYFFDSVEKARHESYRIFPPKYLIKLMFKTDTRSCEIEGYVESNSVDMFSKDMKAQISIICPFPYFTSFGDEGTQVTNFYGIDPAFEFPFSNESLTSPLIEFGTIRAIKEKNISYTGDESTGVIVSIKCTGTARGIRIYNVSSRDTISINADKFKNKIGSDLKAGDEIIISTIKKDKYIKLLRDGVYTNILNCLDKNIKWQTLEYGDNLFAFDADEGSENLSVQITNSILYEGV